MCGYEPRTARQQYYIQRSYERYLKTPDGQHIQEAVKQLDGLLGRTEQIRFIETSA
jgi:hypothetical protein